MGGLSLQKPLKEQNMFCFGVVLGGIVAALY